jgi:hypothetical protein
MRFFDCENCKKEETEEADVETVVEETPPPLPEIPYLETWA